MSVSAGQRMSVLCFETWYLYQLNRRINCVSMISSGVSLDSYPLSSAQVKSSVELWQWLVACCLVSRWQWWLGKLCVLTEPPTTTALSSTHSDNGRVGLRQIFLLPHKIFRLKMEHFRHNLGIWWKIKRLWFACNIYSGRMESINGNNENVFWIFLGHLHFE